MFQRLPEQAQGRNWDEDFANFAAGRVAFVVSLGKVMACSAGPGTTLQQWAKDFLAPGANLGLDSQTVAPEPVQLVTSMSGSGFFTMSSLPAGNQIGPQDGNTIGDVFYHNACTFEVITQEGDVYTALLGTIPTANESTTPNLLVNYSGNVFLGITRN
jgi:hypothetical protein